MKYWAQFYEKDSIGFTEAVGSDQVADMDGRHNLTSMKRVAAEIGRKRGYAGFRIARGQRYSEPFFITASVQEL